MKLYGSEVFLEGLAVAAARVKSATFFQMDARTIPFENEFDVVCAFDVLEHVEEDELVLSQMQNAVSAGGGVLLTVPHHPCLWSQQDEVSGHVRRYSLHELKDKVKKHSFEVVTATAFVCLLLPLMWASRFRQRKSTKNFDPMAELRISGTMNVVLESVLDIERALIGWGLRLPVGGSLLLIAKKANAAVATKYRTSKR